MEIIGRARALLQDAQESKALELLAPEIAKHPENVPLLQAFGEALLEANDVETAYGVLQKACELDADAAQGVEKFFYLGQICGGADGCALMNVAITRLEHQLKCVQEGRTDDEAVKELAGTYRTQESLAAYLISRINQGIFAEIEIWMTDLCMEPEAEQQCDQLISHSLMLDAENPEALSLLALMRISQQRLAEAEEALAKSWLLFSQKKENLENLQVDGEDESLQYIELAQPLLQLARFAVELAQYDLAPQIAGAVSDINDNCLDSFYIEALALTLKAKLLYSRQVAHEDDYSEMDYREIEVASLLSSSDETIQTCVADAKLALTQAYRVLNSHDGEAQDPDLVQQVKEMLAAFGEAVMPESMPERGEDNIDWEAELGEGQG